MLLYDLILICRIVASVNFIRPPVHGSALETLFSAETPLLSLVAVIRNIHRTKDVGGHMGQHKVLVEYFLWMQGRLKQVGREDRCVLSSSIYFSSCRM